MRLLLEIDEGWCSDTMPRLFKRIYIIDRSLKAHEFTCIPDVTERWLALITFNYGYVYMLLCFKNHSLSWLVKFLLALERSVKLMADWLLQFRPLYQTRYYIPTLKVLKQRKNYQFHHRKGNEFVSVINYSEVHIWCVLLYCTYLYKNIEKLFCLCE